MKTVVFGSIVTLDPRIPRTDAMVLDGERILFVGSRSDALSLAGANSIPVEIAGTILPGFVDSHLHFLSFGLGLTRFADLLGAESVEDVLARLSAHADRWEGPWVQGRGFDQDKMAEGRMPTRAELDAAAPDRPAVITRVCGHAAVANSRAIALLTDDERRAGDPQSGLFTETAISPLYRLIPPASESEQEAAVLRAADAALKTGITSVGTLLDTPEQMGAYSRLHRRGALPLRVTGMPPQTSADPLHAHGIGTTFGDDRLRMGGAKFFSDGSLGARTALLERPYADEDRPKNLGVRIYDPEILKARTREVQSKGFQIVIHAIGDRAVRESLDAVEQALGADGDNAYHRHRIEHASILPPDLLARMAARKIVAVVQPQFVTSDTWTGERVGADRARHAYPFRSMLEAGIPLALSSDCPVERLDSFALLAAAVGRHEWSPDETLTVDEALRAYTLGSAYSLHAEARVGSLAAGKLADFIALDRDPANLSATDLRSLKVQSVWIGGKPVR